MPPKKSPRSLTAVDELTGRTRTDELLTVDEAAGRMKMSTRHVRRLIAERQIPYHRLGRNVRLNAADIEAYITASRVEPTTAAN